MDNRFLILEICVYHREPSISKLSIKHLQSGILYSLAMMLPIALGLVKSMHPKSTTSTYKYIASIILTCI
jgi:hypothetical protein